MDQTDPVTLVTPVLVSPVALAIPIAPVILVNVLSPGSHQSPHLPLQKLPSLLLSLVDIMFGYVSESNFGAKY